MAAVTQHRPSDALAGRRYGSFAGKPAFSGSTHPVDVLTQHRPDAAIGGKRYGSFAGRSGVSVPTITSVTAVSGTELAVAWTGTATEYRLDGGSAVSLPDGTSPDTISGLTPNTEYSVQLRDGAGDWSAAVSEWTDNTGGGGGSLLEITPAAGALVFTGYVPTVARTENQWVAPGSGALVFTGYAPTVDRTGSREVAPSAGALRFAGYVPTVEILAGSQTVEPAAGALRLTGYVPTVSVSAQGGGGKKRKRRPTLVDTPYTHDDYVQWAVRTVAVVAASGALDA